MGAPATRGCMINGGRRLLQGELPMRGADRKRKRRCCLWGGLPVSGAAEYERQGCLWTGVPLRGAAGLQMEGDCFWGVSRCAGLLD